MVNRAEVVKRCKRREQDKQRPKERPKDKCEKGAVRKESNRDESGGRRRSSRFNLQLTSTWTPAPFLGNLAGVDPLTASPLPTTTPAPFRGCLATV